MSKHFTPAEVEAHQKKHHGSVQCTCGGFVIDGHHTDSCPRSIIPTETIPAAVKPKKPRQNKTEAEYGRILETQKQRGEIHDWRPFGIRLEWGVDPATQKPMVYSPDFTVWRPSNDFVEGHGGMELHEVKGPYIYPKDMIRFRGCRADWPMFRFQLHQRNKAGEWNRLE